MLDWYCIKNVNEVDSPALIVYPDRIQDNINLAIKTVGNVDKLRPHVKTNKTAEVCRMMMQSGIKKFKCATIAEAEMLAMEDAPDVLLAYQPTGPKIQRLLSLVKAYPETVFSCLVDNDFTANCISEASQKEGIDMQVFIDLNVGMNRTGISVDKTETLAKHILSLPNIQLKGLHAYDGHIHDHDLKIREEQSNLSYQLAIKAMEKIQILYSYPLLLIIGGTPTFSIHARRNDCECSPGTFVFWDFGYNRMINELAFEYSAVVLSRVISVIDDNYICIDLGYKAIASESPLPRVHFLNAPSAVPTAHSEEHLVLKVPNSGEYPIGTVLYGIPVHICPTVALYDKACVVSDNTYIQDWEVIARKRYINH